MKNPITWVLWKMACKCLYVKTNLFLSSHFCPSYGFYAILHFLLTDALLFWQQDYDIHQSVSPVSSWTGDGAQHSRAEASSFQARQLGASDAASHPGACNCRSSWEVVGWRVSSSLQHQPLCKFVTQPCKSPVCGYMFL